MLTQITVNPTTKLLSFRTIIAPTQFEGGTLSAAVQEAIRTKSLLEQIKQIISNLQSAAIDLKLVDSPLPVDDTIAATLTSVTSIIKTKSLIRNPLVNATGNIDLVASLKFSHDTNTVGVVVELYDETNLILIETSYLADNSYVANGQTVIQLNDAVLA